MSVTRWLPTLLLCLGLLVGSAPGWTEITRVTVTIDSASCALCTKPIGERWKEIPGITNVTFADAFAQLQSTGIMSVAPGVPVNLAALEKPVTDSGFTVKAMGIEAEGEIVQTKGRPVRLRVPETGQEFPVKENRALKDLLGQSGAARARVRVTAHVLFPSSGKRSGSREPVIVLDRVTRLAPAQGRANAAPGAP